MCQGTAFWYFVVLAGGLGLYGLTSAPAVLWQDSGLFVYRILHNDIEGKLGLATAHPLYVMIGIAVKHVPLGDMARRVNLISAVFGAVAIANLFLLLRLWLVRILPALIGALTLAVSWTFWQHASIAEVCTLYAAQMLGELIVLLQYIRTKRVGYLYLLGLFNGLAIANHMWGSLAFICYLVFLIALLTKKQITWKHSGIIAGLWIIGAAPYEYLVIRHLIQTGDMAGTVASALFGTGWQGQVLNTSLSTKIVLENIIFILLNFPTPNFLLLFAGLWALRKTAPSRGFAAVILAMSALYLIFAFRYTVPDRYSFFLPFYCFAAIFIALGADSILKRYCHRNLLFLAFAFALLPIAVYCVTPALGRKFYKPLAQRRQRPYRDEYKYFLQPWKTGYRGAEKFAEEALETVERDAVIWAYTTDVHALLYVQENRGKRSDVRIVSVYDMGENAPLFSEDTIEQLLKTSAVYVTSSEEGYCPEYLLQRYEFEKSGLLWKVID